MTFRQFNAVYRPLVDQAWSSQCSITGVAPNNNCAKDRWYREQLHVATNGRIRSTKSAHQREYPRLISHFRMLSVVTHEPHIEGWSDGQNVQFAKLEAEAWTIAQHDSTPPDRNAWLDNILVAHGVINRVAPDCTASFDSVMSDLAIIAGNNYWIDRTAHGPEFRIRYQLERFIVDLAWLDKRQIPSAYIHGIWRQAGLLPRDIDAAPAALLRKALAMLDTHIRRLCRDYDIKPSQLPSRSYQRTDSVRIREANQHIHIGHALEHCPPVAISPSSAEVAT